MIYAFSQLSQLALREKFPSTEVSAVYLFHKGKTRLERDGLTCHHLTAVGSHKFSQELHINAIPGSCYSFSMVYSTFLSHPPHNHPSGQKDVKE